MHLNHVAISISPIMKGRPSSPFFKLQRAQRPRSAERWLRSAGAAAAHRGVGASNRRGATVGAEEMAGDSASGAGERVPVRARAEPRGGEDGDALRSPSASSVAAASTGNSFLGPRLLDLSYLYSYLIDSWFTPSKNVILLTSLPSPCHVVANCSFFFLINRLVVLDFLSHRAMLPFLLKRVKR